MFDDGNVMMEEIKVVIFNLIIELELLFFVGVFFSLVKEIFEMVDKLLIMVGGNMIVFFGNDTGVMEEIKMVIIIFGFLIISSGKNNGLFLMDIFKLLDEGVISGSVMNIINIIRSVEKFEGNE